MRLLQCSGASGFHLTGPFRPDEAIPPYAILSHTWGKDDDEVTYNDLISGTGTGKPGYEKIRFCAAQTQQDGLNYFWIDTCCINKDNKAELSYALKSMFRWYRDASRCYAYLQDVSTSKQDKDSNIVSWESSFRKSRWFKRGWTLQEFLAPRIVEFFSQQGKLIGDKVTLQQQLHEISGLPKEALLGKHLSHFTIPDRYSWMQDRETKLEEDKAYALMGILDLSIPPLYGEGATRAFQRLQDEQIKIDKCMQDLHITDPECDKARIEQTKGGLLEDLYLWILRNPDYQRWRKGSQSRLLWIKGDPGKGKTMLLCGIIDELSRSLITESSNLLSYFFCQAADSRINTATSVLRGLLFMLARRQPSLITSLREKHDKVGKALFEDANAWVVLSEEFTSIVHNPSLQITYLAIDALDECITDRSRLLDLIVTTSSATSRIKWIISSRNWPDIEQSLERADKVKLSLELNAESVSTAVRAYIEHRVSRFALKKKCSDVTKRDILEYLYKNANDTFLWAAFVCQRMDEMSRLDIMNKLKTFPPGLDALYQRMMQQIDESDDANLCKHVLGIVSVVYQPVTLQELTSLVEELDGMSEDLDLVGEVVSRCGSLLIVRDGIIYFVHQSAKDFLTKEAKDTIFPFGSNQIHHTIFSRSLQVMSSTLQKDMYGLCDWGYSIEQLPHPKPVPLAADALPTGDLFQWADSVDIFLRKSYLYWLESLSLCRSISKGVISMTKLEALVNNRAVKLPCCVEVIRDAGRHIMYYKSVMESHPLQIYISALIFSPSESLIRKLYDEEGPREISIKPRTREYWSSCIQTLEGHSADVESVTLSHDSMLIASASYDRTVKIWDTKIGNCLQTLKGHNRAVASVSFSCDSTLLVSASWDGTIKIWDTSSWQCLKTLEGHTYRVKSVVFSHHSVLLISISADSTVEYWDIDSGQCTKKFEGFDTKFDSVAMYRDSTRLRVATSSAEERVIRVWDANNGECLQTLEGHGCLAFSHDSNWLASKSDNDSARVWETSSGRCLQTLEGHEEVIIVAFSPDSILLASVTYDHRVRIWDVRSGQCVQILHQHPGLIHSVSFSHDSSRLVSGSDDGMVSIWDLTSGDEVLDRKDLDDHVETIILSHDQAKLAILGVDVIMIWDANSGECLRTLDCNDLVIESQAFSPDSSLLACGSVDGFVVVWHLCSGESVLTLKGHTDPVVSLIFSHDSAWLASASLVSLHHTIKIWDAETGRCLQTLFFESQNGRSYGVGCSVVFSPDSSLVAFATYDDHRINLYDVMSGGCVRRLEGHKDLVRDIAFSSDATLLASSLFGSKVKLWDLNSDKCLQTFNLARNTRRISFSINDSCLRTDHGTISLDDISRLKLLPTNTEPEPPQYQGLSISVDDAWIYFDSKKLIWIPPEYRSYLSVVSKNAIYVGGGPQGFWMCKLEL